MMDAGLFVHEAGAPDSPAIVFLHGGGLSGRMWAPQFARLRDYRCLAPDLPEQGRSAAVRPLTLDDAAERVAALIRERVPAGRASVVGLSLGGAVALTLLRRAPETVDRAVVSGAPAGLGRALGMVADASAGLYRLLRPATLARLGMMQFGIPVEYRALVAADLARTATADFVRSTTRALMALQLPRVGNTPILVAVGGRETLAARRAARMLVATVPQARGMVAPGLGHVWNLQDPDLFTGMVRAWLTATPLPSALRPLAGTRSRAS